MNLVRHGAAHALISARSSFRLGPFTVDPGGRLHPIAGAGPCFRCFWNGRPIHARLAAETLELRAGAGRIPSSAQTDAAERRRALFALLRILPAALPLDWSAELEPDHSVRLRTVIALPQAPTPVELLCAVTCFALEAAPYLDLLDETGLMALAGMAKT